MNKRFVRSAVVLVGAFVAVNVSAGPVYKCIDAKGVAAYQQEPCPKASAQVGKGYAPTVAPSKNLGWAAQSSTLAKQERQRQALYEKEAPRRTYSAPPPRDTTLTAVEPAPKPRNDRVQNNDMGSTKIDQFGRPYTKVAPNVLIDQRTSRPCITNGNNEIVSCQ
jgi:hypothetical protein